MRNILGLTLVVAALAVAPAAYAWSLIPKDDPIVLEEYEPQFAQIAHAVLDGPTDQVTWTCDNGDGLVEVHVSSPFYHTASGTYRRNIGVSLNPPTSAATVECELLDGTTVIRGIAIEFTGAGVQAPQIEIEFVGAG